MSATGSSAPWTGFFRDLKARGLGDVYLVTSDAHLGIQAAVSDVLQHVEISPGRIPPLPEPESTASWTGFVRDLKARGLGDVYLVTTDAHLCIQTAGSAVLPHAAVSGTCHQVDITETAGF